jgi:hypothetical protein
VGAELSAIPADHLAATWLWIGRLDKLRDQLEVCGQ